MATKSESNAQGSTKVQRDRSPAYPFISLKTAIARAIAFDAKFGRHGSPLNMAGLAWGYKGDSSQSSQTLSALKYFGLVEYSGPTNERVVNLTDDARNYMRAQQASIKEEIIKRCALRPKAMQMYWSRWGAIRPITEICLDQLIIKDGFVEGAAKVFLRVYDETIEFAGLQESDKLDEEAYETAENSENSENPLPPPPLGGQMNTYALQAGQTPALNRSPPAGVRQDTFTLDEGQAVLQWPERLSADSFDDFQSWIQLQLKKIKRSIPASSATPDESDQ